MRIFLKNHLLDMIVTLYQAHDEIMKVIQRRQNAFAQSLLNQCQECAISIGSTIEEFEGKEFVALSYIEEYCESLYSIYEQLYLNDIINGNQIYKQLNSNLSKIENSIRYNIVGKKEFVFLPYKASMWDSLESVWKAADEDPECDAYVIPIPYYDKNPDGSLRNEHYEGNKFPPEVPITHYEHYDFKTRHPDAIFIHNPYDEYNYVTTVHPFFYTNKLKEYGERLIYIPYYVSAEVSPDNNTVMEDRSGYVLTNGVLYSDMVFVQSENTKKLFVNILEKNVTGVGRSYWENKIYGIGSPKFERINNTMRDDTRLSSQWKSIIYTKEGIRKQTVFYNISVSTLLNYPEILEKIEDTLDFFRINTNLALWWRPHPLYESTLASMRPELLEKYKTIVKKYKTEMWGIFDEGVDLNWAIAETDAYYGDRSSVVYLYKEAKKPVMIQNALVKSKHKTTAEDILLWPSAFFYDKSEIWFIHGKMNILMRYDLDKKYTYIINRVPNESDFPEGAYCGIYKWKNIIYLIPSWAREIALYNLVEKKFKKIPLKNIEAYDGKSLFRQLYVNDEYLYCIPSWYHAIVKIDMNKNKIEYIETCQTNDEYINDTTQIDNMVIGIYAYTYNALFFDLETDEVLIKKVGNQIHYFTTMSHINKDLYLFDAYQKCIFKVYGPEYMNENKLCEISADNIALYNLPQNLLLIDSVDDSKMQILNSNNESIYYNTVTYNQKNNNLLSIYHSGIENSNVNYKEPFIYFSRDSYSICQFKNNLIKEEVSMKLSENEFSKLKKIIPNINQLENLETEIYKLGIWIKQLERHELFHQNDKTECGWKILQIVKKNMGEM